MIHRLVGEWSLWTLAVDAVVVVIVFTASSYALTKWLVDEPLLGRSRKTAANTADTTAARPPPPPDELRG
jgi:hypothetical protein